MSAYIVDNETIDRVLNTLITANSNPGVHISCPDIRYTDTPLLAFAPGNLDAINALGRKLLRLNWLAYLWRYPHERKDEPQAMRQALATYRYGGRGSSTRFDAIQAHKTLSALVWQCSEGPLRKTELYRQLRWFTARVAETYVKDLPEYQAARWE